MTLFPISRNGAVGRGINAIIEIIMHRQTETSVVGLGRPGRQGRGLVGNPWPGVASHRHHLGTLGHSLVSRHHRHGLLGGALCRRRPPTFRIVGIFRLRTAVGRIGEEILFTKPGIQVVPRGPLLGPVLTGVVVHGLERHLLMDLQPIRPQKVMIEPGGRHHGKPISRQENALFQRLQGIGVMRFG